MDDTMEKLAHAIALRAAWFCPKKLNLTDEVSLPSNPGSAWYPVLLQIQMS